MDEMSIESWNNDELNDLMAEALSIVGMFEMAIEVDVRMNVLILLFSASFGAVFDSAVGAGVG